MRDQIGFLKERNIGQKGQLKKAKDSTDYIAKIKELEKEIKTEKLNYRERDKKKLKEIHKNYGADDTDFEKRLLETEDFRINIKK